MITEMNSHLSQYLNQLTREIRNAERSGNETKKKRLEVAAHYILIKIYTGEGYHRLPQTLLPKKPKTFSG